jgi:septal ring factor EnvC (AmiA/AmiB activator)
LGILKKVKLIVAEKTHYLKYCSITLLVGIIIGGVSVGIICRYQNDRTTEARISAINQRYTQEMQRFRDTITDLRRSGESKQREIDGANQDIKRLADTNKQLESDKQQLNQTIAELTRISQQRQDNNRTIRKDVDGIRKDAERLREIIK